MRSEHEIINETKFPKSRCTYAVTGFGILTPCGLGLDSILNAAADFDKGNGIERHKILNFNAGTLLSDRKVMKVVAHRDVLGLAAFETCLKNSGINKENIVPERTGMFVGAAPSSILDNVNYNEAVDTLDIENGIVDEERFGEVFASAAPTTLLNGLPNNVLCYGSKTIDARGPNSNYTAMETSSHLAVYGAVRSIKRGRNDCVIAGGYSSHLDQVFLGFLERRGLGPRMVQNSQAPGEDRDFNGTDPAEGSAFMAIESPEHAKKRGANVLCQLVDVQIGNNVCGPFDSEAIEKNTSIEVLSALIVSTLTRNNLSFDQLGLISLSSSGIESIDRLEQRAIVSLALGSKVDISEIPNISISRLMGNLMEASGIVEIALMHHCYQKGSVPVACLIPWPNSSSVDRQTIKSDRRYGLIVRTSMSGEHSCVLVDFNRG
ncbi:MAG: beta-ketoacyl synthase N-terminal-like domain-containing protein [Proteobacteria bacterium]|nr:beta-ketoacyl synthase N-terminal-like domain-containing protein [Pseudomonadota bacterium]